MSRAILDRRKDHGAALNGEGNGTLWKVEADRFSPLTVVIGMYLQVTSLFKGNFGS